MTADRLSALSPRQLECLHLVAQGYEAKEIGRRLGISDLTVKNHLSAARAALGVGRSIDAARLVAAWKGSGAPDTSAADTGAPRTSAPGGIADRSYLDDEPPRRSDPAGELRDGAHGSIGVGGLVGRSLLLPGPTRRGQRNGLGLGARLALVVLLTVLLIAAVGFFVQASRGLNF
ncbi:helix-turn-helix domain-containing protein [Sphingomonas rubra]|uniref:Regulatory protein, luxR family n=1 Tax=Sphingomonas rubra TaxID=634430 RepID=A0A1I5STS9_9SPHN|nr:helix-turn-helix transcriptional regulator [Sphingomonas rubra]SFP74149.1 regulatory protein, luxR family [Sphingomonas rubra]